MPLFSVLKDTGCYRTEVGRHHDLGVVHRLRDKLAANDPINAYTIEELAQSKDVRLVDHFVIERHEPGHHREVARLLNRQQSDAFAAMMQADSGIAFAVKPVRAATGRAR